MPAGLLLYHFMNTLQSSHLPAFGLREEKGSMLR